MNIPGLIASKKDESKLTSAELQAKRNSFEAYMKNWKPGDIPDSMTASYQMNLDEIKLKFGDDAYKQAHLANQYYTGVDPYHGLDLGNENYKQQFIPNWEYKQFPDFGNIKKPSPSRNGLETQDMARYLQEYLKPKKSEFETLLDAMFDTSEKEQFLITLGFEFTHENGEDWISRTVAGLLEKGKKADLFDKIFLREMTIKFKNLLISKNSLKMKLGG